jgi:putative transposase
VHRSSYKYWKNRSQQLSPEQVELHSLIKAAFEESNCSSGARTIASIVRSRGTDLSRYRAGRLMKRLELVSCQLPDHKYKKANQEDVALPNKLDRQLSVTKPNQVWCGDVT